MKKYFTFYTSLFALSVVKMNAAIEVRPNIVLFMVDDMGWQDTSVPFGNEVSAFNRLYQTPNMERLAKMGVKFTQAYASSVSSPTRCSLITGSNAARHRVTNWTLHYNKSTDHEHPTLTMPSWNVNGVQPYDTVPNSYHATTFVELLRQSGYHTIHVGKAHFGAISTAGAEPKNLGFEVNIAGHAAGGLASFLGEQRFGHNAEGRATSDFSIPDLEKYWDKDIFVTEALTIEAIEALKQSENRKQPFFLYMAHYAVHVPIMADKRFIDKYSVMGMNKTEAAYATMVEGMDKSLGDLLDYLESSGQRENTVVIFMSDNGGLSASGRGGTAHTHNAPLNSGKGSAYEGGIREPMLVSWHGVVKPTTTCDVPVIIEDFFPTILEMAGVKRNKVPQTVDGISFVPLLRGKNNVNKNRSLYWNYPNNWGPDGPGIGASCTVRHGDWKLIHFYADGRNELYNIANDIGEKENLADKNLKKTAQLAKQLGHYLRTVDAQRPSFKDSGKPCPFPDGIED